jgi:hypothetical protein
MTRRDGARNGSWNPERAARPGNGLMTKRTKVLSGEAARKYFRTLFAADPGQTPASASRLADTCVREIAELRVRMPVVASRTASLATATPTKDLTPPAVASARDGAEPDPVAAPHSTPAEVVGPPAAAAPPVQPPEPARGPEPVPAAPQQTPVAELPPTEPTFDPFAFSLIVALRRDGPVALLARLIAIDDVARLREIAKAQHVGIPAGADDVAAIAAAIVAGTERRVAHREAAAS